MSETRDFIVNYLNILGPTLEEFTYNPEKYLPNVEIVYDEDIGSSIEDDPDSYDEHNSFKIVYYFLDFDIYLQYTGSSNSSMDRLGGFPDNFDSLIEVIPADKRETVWVEVKPKEHKEQIEVKEILPKKKKKTKSP